ncbi:MAG: YczE/YyaS/YitT family protein [Candidatus Izemoplasmataceae bacterium]
MNVTISVKNTIYYLLGCLAIALGVALVVRSELGTSPYDTLHVAIYETTPLTIGQATVLVALITTFMVMILQRHYKYLFMAIPIFMVGAFIDLFDVVLLKNFYPDAFMIKVMLFLSSLLLLPLGGALLILSTYPAGVFDELMIALMRVFKTKHMIKLRILIDISFLLLALALTLSINRNIGSLQIGTFIFIVSIGPLLKQYLKLFRRQL